MRPAPPITTIFLPLMFNYSLPFSRRAPILRGARPRRASFLTDPPAKSTVAGRAPRRGKRAGHVATGRRDFLDAHEPRRVGEAVAGRARACPRRVRRAALRPRSVAAAHPSPTRRETDKNSENTDSLLIRPPRSPRSP